MNEYRIIDKLTSGSFGSVFKCVRKSDGTTLVLKRIPLTSLSPDTRDSSLLEVELMQQLHHPYIVKYRDSFVFNQTDLCIVMDFYPCGDLGDAVRKASDDHRPFTEQIIMQWFVQIALALHYLHSHRIVHRDLKTQNVFLDANRDVAVGDFGVAQIPDGEKATAAGPSTGTPLYMAPEVLQGHPSTLKSDVWSLGCILYEMLSLRHPFHASDISGLVIKVMRGAYSPVPSIYDCRIARLVDQMLERDPRRRPLIDEILASPVMRGFLASVAAVRGPHGNPSSGEAMLRKQLMAFGAHAGPLPYGQGVALGAKGSGAYQAVSPQQGANGAQLVSPQRHEVAAPSNTSPSVSPAPPGVQGLSRQQKATVVPPAHLTKMSNVDDMRAKTLFEIETEVLRLRQLVQPDDPLPARPSGQLHASPQHGSVQPGWLPSSPQGYQSQPSTYHEPAGANDRRQQSPQSSRQSDWAVRSPSKFVASNPAASPGRKTNLSDVQHRNKLHSTCVSALGAKAYGQIYAYYYAVPSQLRDPQRVVHMVQDRALWPILPMVDEVVKLDEANSVDLSIDQLPPKQTVN